MLSSGVHAGYAGSMSHVIDFATNDTTKQLTLAGIAGHADYFRCTLHVLSRGFCFKREFSSTFSPRVK